MVEIPHIETDRLILRLPNYADWPAYESFMRSQRAAHMGGPYSTSAAWGLFCHDTALWHLFGHGALMIEMRATGECIGQVGINAGPFFPEPELGWLLYRDAEGQGFAFEAAGALRDWVFESGAFTSLVSYIDPQNARSRLLAERLGAVLDATAIPQDPGDLVFRHSP